MQLCYSSVARKDDTNLRTSPGSEALKLLWWCTVVHPVYAHRHSNLVLAGLDTHTYAPL